MSQARNEPTESSDACFAHPADPSNLNDSINDDYQRTYPLSNSNSLNRQFGNKRHGPRSRTYEVEMPLSQTNIYVRGLPPNFTSEDLKELCSKFGSIVSTKAVVEPETNRCRGYAFCDFASAQAASQALSAINAEGIYEAEMAKEIRGKTERHLEQDPTNLYIANLPRDFTESSIREMLCPYGMVISTRVLRNPDGTSRCVGFARMETKQCCDQIISCYNGKKLDENGDPLVVKLADSGARRPKHSTSSSGQSSSDIVYSNWPTMQGGRYSYPTSGYNDQFSFSPILSNGGFQVYDPYGQNLANVTNVPMAMPYSIYQSPTRQLPSQPQAPSTPNQQIVYPQQVPMQQQSNDFYSKNVYKQQNFNASVYYPAFVPYASEYVVNQQQYVQSPASYTNASMVSGQDYSYSNGTGTPIYVAGQFYTTNLSQLPVQMPEGSKPDSFTGPMNFSSEPDDASSDNARRPASVEKYDTIGVSTGQFPQANVRSYASDTKLNNS
ncbi:hypothetical protein M3Y97_00800200 [Aphelenchoides bicaudatus]|nr:hypothetical protein M3Y97_00800200 [Aphelenchoides bicaudatus]